MKFKAFKKIVDKTSDIFDSLPPPVPSNLNQVSYYNNSQYRNLNSTGSTHPLTSLSAYNNINGGCYTGDSLITMNNGMQKRVNEIKKGDKNSDSSKTTNKEQIIIDGLKTTPKLNWSNLWMVKRNYRGSRFTARGGTKHFEEVLSDLSWQHIMDGDLV